MNLYLNTLLCFAIVCLSCSHSSQTEKELREAINTTLQVKQFDTVLHKNSILTFQELKEMYDFLSIIYLQNGCKPCYPKFIEWHLKMDSLMVDDNYTLLFVIQGNDYDEFMGNVLSIKYVDDKFYTIMDPQGKFVEQNKDIPRWIIDSSVLIDSENKIKLVGAPWINEEMTELFYSICTE